MVNRSESNILEAKKRRDQIPEEAVKRKEEFEKSKRRRREEARQAAIKKELKEGKITSRQGSKSIRSRPEDTLGKAMDLLSIGSVVKSLEDSHARNMAYPILESDVHT
jgi:hypothetical protein